MTNKNFRFAAVLRYCIAQYNNCISGFNFVTSRLFSTLSLPWTLQTYVESATTKSLVTQQFFFVKVQFSQRRLIILRKNIFLGVFPSTLSTYQPLFHLPVTPSATYAQRSIRQKILIIRQNFSLCGWTFHWPLFSWNKPFTNRCFFFVTNVKKRLWEQFMALYISIRYFSKVVLFRVCLFFYQSSHQHTYHLMLSSAIQRIYNERKTKSHQHKLATRLSQQLFGCYFLSFYFHHCELIV